MPGSIMHQLVKAASGVEVAEWIADEAISAMHLHAIQVSDDGTEFSLWQEKWPLDYLQSIRHTRSYAKNYDNDPMARDGIYWTREDFEYGHLACTKTALFVDPAVTSTKKSDWTGLAVIGFVPATPGVPSKVVVKAAYGVKLSPEELRQHVATKILPEHPEVRRIVVEVNQGGDLWKGVFHDLPDVAVEAITASESKEVRFAEALEIWQRHRVLCESRFPMLEEQAVGFPRAAYDDVIDAGATGVRYFLKSRKIKAKARTEGYTR
jgi:phage terminase large subunit-like protein